MKLNLFDNFKVNQEYKKIKNVINYAPKNITPEFIKNIPDFNIREKIYITYDAFSQEEFDNFFNLYKLDKDIAMKTLDSGIIIYSNETVNLIKNNLDKIKLLISYEVDINFIFNTFGQIAEKIDKYYKLCSHYGKEVVQYLSDKNMSFLENDKITKLDSKFVLENIDELKEICGLSEIKFNCLLKLYKEKSDKYNFVKEHIIKNENGQKIDNYDDGIILFLEKYNFDADLISLLKTNSIYNTSSMFSTVIENIGRLGNNFSLIGNECYNSKTFCDIASNFLINFYKSNNNLNYYSRLIVKKITNGAIDETCFKNMYNIKNKYYVKLNESNKLYLDCFIGINQASSIKEIDNIINVLITNKFDVKTFISEIKNVESKQFNDAIFKPDLNMGYINEDGIRIIDSNSIDLNNFKMFVHSVGKSGNTSHNDDIAEELLKNPSKWNGVNGGSYYMSLSLLSKNQTGTYGNDLILGFDANNIEIYNMNVHDANTGMRDKFKTDNLNPEINDYTPENINEFQMKNYYFGERNYSGYNEICINRIKNMTPKYILVKKNCPRNNSYNEYVKKWAKYFNIPVVILDGKLIKMNSLKRINEECNLIKETGITYEKFLNLLLDVDTVCQINSKFNYYEIFDFLINLCENNYDNFVEFENIINLFGKNLNYLLYEDVQFGSTENDIRKREKRKLDISEFYRKLEYLRNKYNTKEVESEHKLGFVAINCVFLSLTVILIFTLIYILFKYFN